MHEFSWNELQLLLVPALMSAEFALGILPNALQRGNGKAPANGGY